MQYQAEAFGTGFTGPLGPGPRYDRERVVLCGNRARRKRAKAYRKLVKIVRLLIRRVSFFTGMSGAQDMRVSRFVGAPPIMSCVWFRRPVLLAAAPVVVQATNPRAMRGERGQRRWMGIRGVRSYIWAAANLALAVTGVGMAGSEAAADTLEWALVQAYQNNPSLNAQRAALRATDENVPQALSGTALSLALPPRAVPITPMRSSSFP